MTTPGEVLNLCPHNQTRQFCAACTAADREAAKQRAIARHPSQYDPERNDAA